MNKNSKNKFILFTKHTIKRKIKQCTQYSLEKQRICLTLKVQFLWDMMPRSVVDGDL